MTGTNLKPQPMNSSDDSNGSKASLAISKSLPGPDFLRYYPAHRLMVWQPQGTLDDVMLDEIAEWLVHFEKASLPFKSFVDLSHLTTVRFAAATFLNLREKERRSELLCFPTTGSPLALRGATSR